MSRPLLMAVWVPILLVQGMGTAQAVDFARDIQPILADHCWHCHGADEATREGMLRLDQRDAALVGGDSARAAIVPGKPAESELMRRISAADADLRMPPDSTNKPLSSAQQALLRQWIEEGAAYAEHWAFRPPRKLPLPTTAAVDGASRQAAIVETAADAVHPIDAWVTAKLAAVGLELSPPAPPEVLCRRLYLDLIGLPPAPAELEQFRQEGYAATVERLLQSERFGEKWARQWLDVARYADTNGYEKDLRREQWAWRDWVVEAFNTDMPYDQFLIEQVAGDLLPNPTPNQIVATGFLRNSMINEEGAIVPEQFRMFEMFDRMDCLGKAVLGLTLQCAQCHTHKFDPLSQHEYYGLFAFLNNAYEAKSPVYTPDAWQAREVMLAAVAQREQEWRAQRPDWQSELAAWEQSVLAADRPWVAWETTELGSVSGLNHPVQLADGSILMLGHTSSDVFFVATPDLPEVTAVRLEILNHGDLPQRGPGRAATGTWSIGAVELLVQRPGDAEWTPVPFGPPVADAADPEVKSDDGKRVTGPVALLVDGSDTTFWKADRKADQRNLPAVAILPLQQPARLPPGTRWKLVLRMGEMVGCCRVSVTGADALAQPPAAQLATVLARVPAAERSAAEQAALFAAWRRQLPEAQELNRAIESLWADEPAPLTSVLHLQEREPRHRRGTWLLDRGEWDRSLEQVEPGTPAALHAWPANTPRDRLGFAKWLASPDSPLTARVAVNRLWLALFGEGLVETPEDFGTRATLPEHLELLDWLAVELMEQGWSQKQILRLMVHSRTYQQQSIASARQREIDPRNRLLSRGPRFRADAEVLRDVALSAAGLLQHRLGGAPIIPPVPQNVLDYNFVYPDYWTATTGPDRYRRSLYVLRKRSMPDPVLTTLDAPNGDTACARRARSDTPLGALVVLNEPVFFEAAQAMALRVLREGGDNDPARVRYAFQLCVARLPRADELVEVERLLASRRQRIAAGWLNPRELTTGDPARLPDLPSGASPQDAAAWTLVCRVLLNLDETLTKN